MATEKELEDYAFWSERSDHALRRVEDWVLSNPNGKRWLSRIAADVGVPLQLTLPFTDPEEKD